MIKFLRNLFRRWFKNRYEGAAYNPARSLIPAGYQSVRFDASAGTRAELARRARYFERNNPIVNRLVDIFECYTVGCEVQVMPASADPTYNANAKASLDLFFRYPGLSTLQGMATLCGLMARTWFIDGEIFILKTKGASGRPRIQLIEGHRVQTPPSQAHNEGESVIDGIAIDGSGRPIGYWIAEEDKTGRQIFRGMTPADQVIHLFEPSRANQYRGLTMLYPVLNELHDLDDLHMLEMQAAKANAAITNVVLNKAGEISAEGLMRSAFTQGKTISTGGQSSETRQDYYQQVLGAGTLALKTGEDIKQFKSDRPGVVTMDYWRYKTELVCAGVGIPYVLVFPDSMQGTVYRGALDMANSFFRARSQVLAGVIRDVSEYYLKWANNVDPLLRDKPGDWFKMSIYPPRAVNVDVGRNSSAMLAELAVGATNYELIYGPLGLDWREQFDKLAEQKRYAASLGLSLTAQPTSPGQPQAQLEDDLVPVPTK